MGSAVRRLGICSRQTLPFKRNQPVSRGTMVPSWRGMQAGVGPVRVLCAGHAGGPAGAGGGRDRLPVAGFLCHGAAAGADGRVRNSGAGGGGAAESRQRRVC